MNKKVAEIAARIADKVVNLPSDTADFRTALVEALGEELQALLYPERCPGCGDRLCPSCGEHMYPPLLESKTAAEDWDLCPDCGIYVKPDGIQIAMTPTYSAQDIRVIELQSRKRSKKGLLN